MPTVFFQGSPLGSVWVQRWIVVAIAIVIAIRAIYLLNAAWDFSTDDAYITLRYARQLAEGHGIVWNAGDTPIEGYSNFVFVFFGAAAIKAGLPPMLILKGLSCLALTASCYLLYRLARPWTGPLAAALPAMVLTAYTGTIWWTVSGLETAVYQLIVLTAISAFFNGLQASPHNTAANFSGAAGKGSISSAYWYALAGSLVFLAGLTRPEAPVIGVAMGAGLLLDIGLRARAAGKAQGGQAARRELLRGSRMALVLALSFALPYALYTWWRLEYFGRLLPNTVYCKAAFSGDPLVLIKAFWAMAQPAFVLSIVAFWQRFDTRLFVMALVVLLYVGLLHGVDPIIGHLNRHFLTAFALLLILATVGTLRLFTLMLPMVRAPYRELGLLTAALALTAISFQDQHEYLQDRAERYASRMAMREGLGHWLNARLASNETFMLGDVGMVPFVAQARVIDAFCLNSRAMTSAPISNSAPAFVDYAMAQQPEMIIVHSLYSDRLEPRTELNIYPLLVQHSDFSDRYVHRYTTGLGNFHYWVFARRDRLDYEIARTE